MGSEKKPQPIVGDIVINPESGEKYKKGRLLGKGGFARCYELCEMSTGKLYAGKIVSKARIAKPSQWEKMQREIHIHSQLDHRNVVGFHKHFEDDENVYVILELCNKKSLLHMLKLRKTLTESEVRYFMKQVIEGLRYMHSCSVIHRDLKLGNMFLTDNMEVKIGDFGLAAKLEFNGDRKRTMCGTPNYIAPEVLGKIGHSFEADVWALGCVFYTMLVGRPPFETTSLKETYTRIKHNKYTFPDTLSYDSKDIIALLLTSEPEDRPSLEEILLHDFFVSGYTPEVLSPTVFSTAPHFPTTKVLMSDSSGEIVRNEFCRLRRESTMKHDNMEAAMTEMRAAREKNSHLVSGTSTTPRLRPKLHVTIPTNRSVSMDAVREKSSSSPVPETNYSISIVEVSEMLRTCLRHMPTEEYLHTPRYKAIGDEVLWVPKWVDYSNKYGFGHQLSDKSVGVIFNDKSRICFHPDRISVQYLSNDHRVHTFKMSAIPPRLSKKVTLLDYFSTYMDEHLVKGPETGITVMTPQDAKGGDLVWDAMSPIPKRKAPSPSPTPTLQPYLVKWYRTDKAIAMYLSNGTFQLNFFEDHTKVILSYNNSDHLLTYINQDRISSTYRLLHVAHHGCSAELSSRLVYMREVLDKLSATSEEE
ncbi:serine/threonine-protein kinase PLK1-like isoform X1 [Antedon mediterranea]|uniref:serine/threonine-protein kinase PLK1-like isoform X1 n=1 Tax=Antedon mediterranea TaxID=105859 RepID=UPI003AF5802B